MCLAPLAAAAVSLVAEGPADAALLALVPAVVAIVQVC